MTERLTYTIEETARLLGIGRGTAYAAARAGDLPTVRLGRRLLVPRAALLELLGETPTNSDASAATEATQQTSDQGARHAAYPV
jgi:excisionase family DNA binding protein